MSTFFSRKTPTNEAHNLEIGVDTSAGNATPKVLRTIVLGVRAYDALFLDYILIHLLAQRFAV